MTGRLLRGSGWKRRQRPSEWIGRDQPAPGSARCAFSRTSSSRIRSASDRHRLWRPIQAALMRPGVFFIFYGGGSGCFASPRTWPVDRRERAAVCPVRDFLGLMRYQWGLGQHSSGRASQKARMPRKQWPKRGYLYLDIFSEGKYKSTRTVCPLVRSTVMCPPD